MDERLNRIEHHLLCLAVFMSPMRELRPTEINITYSDILFFLLGGMLLVRRRLQIAPMLDVTVIWMTAMLFLIGGLFISSIVNGSAADSLIVCTQYIFAYVVLPFIILQSREIALTLVKSMVLGVLFVVVFGFIFAVTGYHGGHIYVSGSGRLASFASNPNDFALLIALSTPLLLYLWFSKALPGLVCLTTAICFMIGLVMASSNSGIGATAFGVIIFLLFLGRLGMMLRGALMASLLVLTVATVGYDYLPEVFQKRVLSAVESGSLEGAGTYKDRMEMIVEASDMLDESLILGIGADQYAIYSAHGDPVHNMYLLLWVEGGTISLFGWLMILATMTFIGIRSYQQPGGSLEAAMVLAVTAIIIIAGTTSPHLYSRAWVVPLLVVISMPLSRRAMAMLGSPARPSPQPGWQAAASRNKSLPYRPNMHAEIRYNNRRQ